MQVATSSILVRVSTFHKIKNTAAKSFQHFLQTPVFTQSSIKCLLFTWIIFSQESAIFLVYFNNNNKQNQWADNRFHSPVFHIIMIITVIELTYKLLVRVRSLEVFYIFFKIPSKTAYITQPTKYCKPQQFKHILHVSIFNKIWQKTLYNHISSLHLLFSISQLLENTPGISWISRLSISPHRILCGSAYSSSTLKCQ